MPGGKHDSSKTRVKPVFDQLRSRDATWPRTLLTLPKGGAPDAWDFRELDLRYREGCWEPDERRLRPPVSLLSWLIRTPRSWASTPDTPERAKLAEGDPATVQAALEALRVGGGDREWFLLEGPTAPDVFLETPDALVVVEGKRTEPEPTTSTKWLEGRHQMWRHIDAAWEIAGRRRVFGMFIVEELSRPGAVDWQEACRHLMSAETLSKSFPHRSAAETDAIRRCFLGVTTWKCVCSAFDIRLESLPDEVPTREV